MSVEDGPADPSLHDENWRTFCAEKEGNSALAAEDWGRYRAGLRRLERAHSGRVPHVPLRRALAEDAFFCAVHWRQSPPVVKGALRALLEHPIGVKLYLFAAAEFWQWASRVSPADLDEAEQMVARGRELLKTLDAPSRENMRRMLAVVVDRNRPASPGQS